MREARIIMPFGESNGPVAGEEHDKLALLLSRNFGGCTITTGYGNWVDGDGRLVAEPVAIFDVAMPDTDLNTDRLTILAHETAYRLKQDSVYIRYADGQVFIDKVGKPGRALAGLLMSPSDADL